MENDTMLKKRKPNKPSS